MKTDTFEFMDENVNNNTDGLGGSGPKILAGFLASALDMEEQITSSVYRDYLDPANWPEGLKPDVFQQIKEHLNVLIEDTEKHIKILRALTEKYGDDTKSR